MTHPKSDNKAKLEAFFREEYQVLKSYVKSRMRSSLNADPEDIIQDVAYKLFSGIEGYGPISNMAGFVYRSIANKIIDNQRKSTKQSSSLEYHEEQWIHFSELMYGQADNNYSNEEIKALKTALNQLKPQEKELILAIDFEGYTYKEIATKTGIPAGTLMSQRHRSLAKLNKLLTHKKQNHEQLF